MITRREFLEGSLATLMLLSLNRLSFSMDTEEVFPQGVASADPTHTGAILWTRINPKVYERMKKDLILQISEDMDFKRLVFSGRLPWDRISSKDDHTVRIDLEGKLQPGRTYYYRFVYADVPSMIGRLKTLPEEAQDISIAFATCQNYADGYFTAYRHMAQEDLQLVVHLGDFIYEKIYGPPRVAGRLLELPSGSNIVQNLEDYRYLYRTYLSDPDIRLARAMHTFVHTWDDHEFLNDYYYNYQREYWIGDYPIREREKLLQLRLDSIKAWLEYIPARVKTNFQNRDPLLWITIYRDFKIGSLAHLIMTDGRSYRDKQPCRGKYGAPGCAEQYRTTMLGQDQLRWFLKKLKEDKFVWKVWGNDVQFSQSLVDGKFGSLDAWDGYAGERQKILDFLKREGMKNLLISTGDRHATFIAEIPDSYQEPKEVLGAEFMTPAISSVNSKEMGWWKRNWPNYTSIEEVERAEMLQNPWIKHLNMKNWGYSVLNLNRDRARVIVYTVNKYRKDAPKEVDAEFVYTYGRLEKYG